MDGVIFKVQYLIAILIMINGCITESDTQDPIHIRKNRQIKKEPEQIIDSHPHKREHRGVKVKNVEGISACFPNDYQYNIKSFIISDANTFDCKEEHIEVHADFRPGPNEPFRTATFYLSVKNNCLQTEQEYTKTCQNVKRFIIMLFI